MSRASRQLLLWRAVWMLAAFVVSMLSSDRIFLRQPTGSDENSYVFQAWNFRDGVVARPLPPIDKQFEHDMIIADAQAGWLSRYPPAHPLWLTPGTFFDDGIRVMVALAAALGVGFACAAATALGIPQAFIALPLLLSPFFVFMFGTHLSHTSGFLACAALLWAYARWRATHRAAFAVLAGLAWGFFFLNRTYTAMLIAIPLALDCIVAWLRDRRWPAFLQTTAFAASAAIGVAAYLFYNKLATGDAFTATYLYYEPSENLGFGPRRTQGDEILHTPEVGFATMVENFARLNVWLYGFPGSLAAFGALAALGWRARWTPLLLAIPATIAVGYVAFWYPGVREAGGPVYYFDAMPFLALAAAMGLAAAWTRLAARPAARGVAFAGLLAAVATASSTMIAREGAARAAAQQPRADLRALFASAPPQSLLLVERIETVHFGEIPFNPRGLDTDPLVVRGMGGQFNPVAIRIFSNRTPFLVRGPGPLALEPLAPVDRLGMTYAASKMQRRTGRNVAAPEHPAGSYRAADEGQDSTGWLAFGSHMYLPAGRFRVIYEGHCTGVSTGRPIRVDVATRRSREVLAGDRADGDRTGAIARIELELTNTSTRIEPRMRYGGSGDVRFARVRIEEIPPGDQF